jgi:hypothetical protein
MVRSLRIAVFIFALPLVAGAQTFVPGDVIVGAFSSLPPFSKTILIYNPDGTPKQTFTTDTRLFRDLFVRDSLLFAAANETILRFNAAGSELTPFAMNLDFPNRLSPGAGAIFLFASTSFSGVIQGFDANGSTRFTYTPLSFEDAIEGLDLSIDQCTLLVGVGDRLATLDTCSNRDTPHPFGITLPSTISTLRIRADGTLLVAYQEGIQLLSPSGAFLRFYSLPANFQPTGGLALNPDGSSFWVAASGHLLKIDLTTGATLIGPINTHLAISSITVVGEPRAALAAPPVPLLSTPTFALLGIALAGLAMLRLVRA